MVTLMKIIIIITVKCFWKNIYTNMPYSGRTYVYAGIDVNKTSASNECFICHCQYFLKV